MPRRYILKTRVQSNFLHAALHTWHAGLTTVDIRRSKPGRSHVTLNSQFHLCSAFFRLFLASTRFLVLRTLTHCSLLTSRIHCS